MSAQTTLPISTSNHQSTSIFPLPDSLYTPYYCEENVYLLIKTLEASANILATWACFISNLERRAILFNQKASRHGEDQGSYVIWDYHVIAIAAIRQGGEEKLVVIDRDSKLGEMVDLEGQPFICTLSQCLIEVLRRRLCRQSTSNERFTRRYFVRKFWTHLSKGELVSFSSSRDFYKLSHAPSRTERC